jgi:hypothetical protein
MPRVWIVLVLALAGLAAPRAARAQAQRYEPIRVDFGLVGGYASGLSEGGFGGCVEPKLLLTDHLAAGLRLEGQVTFGASVGDGDTGFSTGSVGLLAAKGEFLLGDFGIRPAVGLGLGFYFIGGDTIESGPDQVVVSHKSGNYFGLSPSLGIDLGRVRLAVTYHVLFGAAVEVEEMGVRKDFSQNFWSFELSFHVGGSKLRPASAR